MIYTVENCAANAKVIDAATGVEITNVVSIDTDAKIITRYEMPLRVAGDEIATYTRKFQSAELACGVTGLPHVIGLRGLQP